MPTVPTFRPNTQLESMPGAQQQNNATPESFGSGIARATGQAGGDLAQFGGELSKLGAQILQRTDAVEAKNAYSQASDQALALLHDPDNGLLNRRGLQAKGLTNEATTSLNKIQTEATKKLTPAQREMFSQFWQGTMDNATTSTARHESDQIGVAEDQANDAIVDNAGAIIAANPYDEDAIIHQINVGTKTLISKYRGSDPTVLVAAVTEFKTKAYAGAMTQMLVNNDAAGADAFLTKHSEEIDKRMHPDLQEQIKRKDAQIVSQKTGDELIDKYRNDPDGEEKAMADIRARGLEGDIRTLAESRVQALFGDQRRFVAEKDKADMENAVTAVRAAPDRATASSMIALEKNPKRAEYMDRAVKMRWADDIAEEKQRQAEARGFARQEQFDIRLEERRAKNEQRRHDLANAKFGELQTVADRDISEGQYDPEAVLRASEETATAWEQTDPEAANNYRQYIQARVIPTLVRESKPTEAEVQARTVAAATVMDQLRTRVDKSISAGMDPKDVARAAGVWALAPEYSANGDPILKNQNLIAVQNYALGKGKEGLVKSERVEGLLRNMLAKTGKKVVSMADHPGLYDAVVAAVPDGSTSVSDPELNKIMADVLAPGVTPGFFSVFGTTNSTNALAAVKAGNFADFQYDVPPDKAPIIKAILKENKMTTDDNHVRQLYGRDFMGKPATISTPTIPPGSIKGFMNWMGTHFSDEMTPEWSANPKAINTRFTQYRIQQQAVEKGKQDAANKKADVKKNGK